MIDERRAAAALVDALGSALRSGDHGLKTAPELLKRLLRDGSWRSFVTQRGDAVTYARFEDFVATPPLKGIGASLDLVRRLVADDPAAMDLLDQALGGQQGKRTDLVSNRHEVDRPAGTTQAAALRRLRKDAPELHEEVLAGRLSAHAAMLKAGFRKPTATVNLANAESAAKVLKEKASPEFLAELKRLLGD